MKKLIVIFLIIPACGIESSLSSGLGLRTSPKEIVDTAWQIIHQDFLDGTFNNHDWVKIRRDYVFGRTYTDQKDAYTAIDTMLLLLNDPYTRFFAPQEFARLREHTGGSYIGAGISIDEQRIVIKVEKNSPAEGKILKGDKIIQIDGQPIPYYSDVGSLLRGDEGTEINLTIDREGNILYRNITFGHVTIQVVEPSLEEVNGKKIAYLRLIEFSKNAASQLSGALDDLNSQGDVDGIVIALEDNPGGLLSQPIEIASFFLQPNHTVVSTVARNGSSETFESSDRHSHYDLPLVVTINSGSASASEILAGALQDHKRAVIVGKTTFGKGLVQQVKTFNDGSGIAVTVAKYLTPNGSDIHNVGIKPDVEANSQDSMIHDCALKVVHSLMTTTIEAAQRVHCN